jgi:L-alanine-DL-glutamate epimerase-like enolase superfamily enzyme
MTESQGISRRQFLVGAGVATMLPSSFRRLAARELKRATIRDVQAMMLQGPARTYTLIKVTSDAGIAGIAEAYGAPGVGVKEQVLALKPWLVGKDPLEIDKLYTLMGRGSPSLSGTRTDGSAHNLMRAVSGVEMALWDLAGKIFEVPTTTLLGGRFRDKVRVYDHAAPRDMLDKASVAEWAVRAKSHASGFTCHKFGFRRSDPASDKARDPCGPQEPTPRLPPVGTRDEDRRELVSQRRAAHTESGDQPVVAPSALTDPEFQDRVPRGDGRDCSGGPSRPGSSAGVAH